MKRNYFFIVVGVALVCLFFIFYSLWKDIQAPVVELSSHLPPKAPYQSYITGLGVVEASSGNILIGSPINRLIQTVNVKVGDKVPKGEKLFCLESKDLEAELAIQKAAYQKALAQYQKLKDFPRKEDANAAEANLQRSQLELDLAEYQNEMVQRLPDGRAISEEEKKKRYFSYEQARANWQQAKADYDKIQKGTWGPDLEIAKKEVTEALAHIQQVKTEIDRTCINSPIDATVLQVNIRPGEFASSSTSNTPLMIIGNTDELHLRVSINQLDIPYFEPNSPAVAFYQDSSEKMIPLKFVRFEPYLISKQYITNEIYEKVDTKVFQIIYQVEDQQNQKLFVGQVMDVFIETPSKAGKFKRTN